jgi:hypothetical protein
MTSPGPRAFERTPVGHALLTLSAANDAKSSRYASNRLEDSCGWSSHRMPQIPVPLPI